MVPSPLVFPLKSRKRQPIVSLLCVIRFLKNDNRRKVVRLLPCIVGNGGGPHNFTPQALLRHEQRRRGGKKRANISNPPSPPPPRFPTSSAASPLPSSSSSSSIPSVTAAGPSPRRRRSASGDHPGPGIWRGEEKRPPVVSRLFGRCCSVQMFLLHPAKRGCQPAARSGEGRDGGVA